MTDKHIETVGIFICPDQNESDASLTPGMNRRMGVMVNFSTPLVLRTGDDLKETVHEAIYDAMKEEIEPLDNQLPPHVPKHEIDIRFVPTMSKFKRQVVIPVELQINLTGVPAEDFTPDENGRVMAYTSGTVEQIIIDEPRICFNPKEPHTKWPKCGFGEKRPPKQRKETAFNPPRMAQG